MSDRGPYSYDKIAAGMEAARCRHCGATADECWSSLHRCCPECTNRVHPPERWEPIR